MTLQLIVDQCPNGGALPFFRLGCKGHGCTVLGKPCKHDGDCGGDAGSCRDWHLAERTWDEMANMLGEIGLVHKNIPSDFQCGHQDGVFKAKILTFLRSMFDSTAMGAADDVKTCRIGMGDIVGTAGEELPGALAPRAGAQAALVVTGLAGFVEVVDISIAVVVEPITELVGGGEWLTGLGLSLIHI